MMVMDMDLLCIRNVFVFLYLYLYILICIISICSILKSIVALEDYEDVNLGEAQLLSSGSGM